MASLWGIVGKAANLLQFLGMDAVTLVATAMSFLRFHRQARTECRKLEESARMLQSLLRTPPGCCWIMAEQQQEEVELVANALRGARDLVESYDGSTLLSRIRRGRSTAGQFRDLRGRIDSYCGFILAANACRHLAVQANSPPPAVRPQGLVTTDNGPRRSTRVRKPVERMDL